MAGLSTTAYTFLLHKECAAPAHNKHLLIKYHAVKEAVKDNEIEIIKISGKDQIADILTKSADQETFKRHTNRIFRLFKN